MLATILKYVVGLKTKEKTHKNVYGFRSGVPTRQPETPTAAIKEQKKNFSKHRQMTPHFKPSLMKKLTDV